jgi:hypothetical protein
MRYQNFSKRNSLQIFLCFDVIWGQKEVKMAFFEELYFVGFCDEINFENPKKCPRKHQQGGKLEDSYSHKKIL